MDNMNNDNDNSLRLQWPEEYGVWSKMHDRCMYPSEDNYKHYGGRGITVCERWDSFENFWADMGQCPPGMILGAKT